jgi:pimeloyl-ACP methyl ester carboxylesterase
MIGSHGFPLEEDEVRALALAAWERGGGSPAAGLGRQTAAILKSGDRTEELRGIRAPTLVIHGDRDRMVHPSGGKATAEAIPGAELLTIRGMGHNLPRGVWEQVADAIAALSARAN